MDRTLDRTIPLLWVATTVLMFVAIGMVFLYAPEEKVMGAAQKIFYFHVPCALVTFLSVFVLLGASVAYLWTRRRAWDNLSRSATEIGLLFCSLVLITGPIWAKPAWGIWWTWEPKLTTTLVLWLLLAGCLMVRGYAEDPDLGARLAAIVGIVAAVDIPIIHRAAVWWGGHHPVLFAPGKRAPLAPEMLRTFLVALPAFLLLYGLLLALRYRLAAVEDRVASARDRLSER